MPTLQGISALLKKSGLDEFLKRSRQIRDKSVNNSQNGFEQPDAEIDRARYMERTGRRGQR